MGGAASRAVPAGGAVSAIAGDYIVHAIAVPPVPEAYPAAVSAADGFIAAFEPWAREALVLTFLDGGAERARGFGASLDRLRDLKAAWDPRDVFAAANPVVPAGDVHS